MNCDHNINTNNNDLNDWFPELRILQIIPQLQQLQFVYQAVLLILRLHSQWLPDNLGQASLSQGQLFAVFTFTIELYYLHKYYFYVEHLKTFTTNFIIGQ